MEHLKTLYRYEVKKILTRRLVQITLLLCILCIAVSVCAGLAGTYYVDGEAVDTHYHMFQVDQVYYRALSGRAIDQELLEEMAEAYGKIPQGNERYTLTEEYEQYARPYSDIFSLVWLWVGENPYLADWEPDEESLYESRRVSVENDWQKIFLTDTEKEFWSKKETELSRPFIYCYHEGYKFLLDAVLTIGVLMLLFVSVSLSGVFAEEHVRRTDQLMLSSAKGKTTVYWAKLCAGSTVAAAGAVLMTVTAAGLTFGIYGTEGFEASIQLMIFTYSLSLTVGQACLIAYGILILTSVFAGLLVMILSELLHSSMAALAVSAGFIISGMIVNIPEQYRVIGQIWNALPMTFLSVWNLFDKHLILIGGHGFLTWQAVPVFYILGAVVTATAGKRVFSRYQVSGR